MSSRRQHARWGQCKRSCWPGTNISSATGSSSSSCRKHIAVDAALPINMLINMHKRTMMLRLMVK